MRIVGPTHYGDLRGPTACELITDEEAAAIHARLGEDPLRADADPDRAWAKISRSRAPLATLLMDQSVIAGAVTHLLHVHRISGPADGLGYSIGVTRTN